MSCRDRCADHAVCWWMQDCVQDCTGRQVANSPQGNFSLANQPMTACSNSGRDHEPCTYDNASKAECQGAGIACNGQQDVLINDEVTNQDQGLLQQASIPTFILLSKLPVRRYACLTCCIASVPCCLAPSADYVHSKPNIYMCICIQPAARGY